LTINYLLKLANQAYELFDSSETEKEANYKNSISELKFRW